MDDRELVERWVQAGLLPPLTVQTYEAEREGLAEDILNWNHGHVMIVVLGEVTVKEHQYH